MIDHQRSIDAKSGPIGHRRLNSAPADSAIGNMRIANSDVLALKKQSSDSPKSMGAPEPNVDGCGSPQPNNETKAIIRLERRNTPPPLPRPSRLKKLHRKTSSNISLTPLYAGPKPTRANGCPLHSCLKSGQSDGHNRHRCPSDSTVSTVSSYGSSRGRKVSFSDVQLREYCRQVGDNPSVTSGCPLGIGWKYNKRGRIDIDCFEADRHKDPVPCQRLTSKEREALLTKIGGVSHTRVLQGQINAYFDRQLRAETLEQIGGLKGCKTIGPRERLYIMKESAARKLDRAKKGMSQSKEQQELWDVAEESARRKSLEDKAQSS